ncbi:FRG domain-containing protein [Chitinophaga filiformis]|uniref:FRG domain-containing protein n=1 Tax=Chitinophaga filiformis TaxID=104663 RepID=A0A1G8CIT9_CHIFI|nr:FRG domain-containing protein [Chitinophaga filiformis]SDH45309.1 FRG domain-containing protein [Chitinophaga filiformis]
MQEVELDTMRDYLDLIRINKEENIRNGNVGDFVFRGQGADYPLIPKICRLKPKGDLFEVEKALLTEFKRTNPLLVQQQTPLNDWDYLTLGQHFGLPTRLLDWSNSALTALWFAVSGHNTECLPAGAYAVVWILMPTDEDFDFNPDEVHPFDLPATRIFRPRLIKQRINNQSGVFTVPSTQELRETRYMNESDHYDLKLIKVKIPTASLSNMRNDLQTLGVNAFSIFPELEGLCAFLQWRYFE